MYSIIVVSLSKPHTSVVNGEFLCTHVCIIMVPVVVRYAHPHRTQVPYVLFPCYKSGYSYSGFLRLVLSMLQAACTAYSTVSTETGTQATPSKREREKHCASETGGMLEQAERK